MQNIITEYVKINDTEEIDPIILWEGAKAVIRGHIIAYALAKKRTREAQQKRISEQINNWRTDTGRQKVMRTGGN